MVKDVSPKDTWLALENDPEACLIDVRTPEEWQLVGIPDVSATGHTLYPISWQVTGGLVNSQFVEELRRAGLQSTQKLYFICRSGARSRSAAMAAAREGFEHVFNVADGFEGPPDGQMHRGKAAGWKASGLPWRQN